MKLKIVLFGIGLILFIMPFFWLKPGQIDIGGDATRLYFYDPFHYLISTLRYVVLPVGLGPEENYFMFLPFVLFMSLLRIFLSPYGLISASNGFQLVLAFFSMFCIIKELLPKDDKQQIGTTATAVFVGIAYIFSPVLVRSAWDKAILTHAQFFVNPVIFLLLLKFFKTNKFIYLLYILLLTLLFSANFSAGGAPPFFAFFPLACTFLVFYKILVLNGKFPFKKLIISFILFTFLHLFHLLPTILSLLDGSGAAFSRAFTKEGQLDIGLNYFLASATNITLRDNLLGLPQLVPSIIKFQFAFLLTPFLLLFALLKNTTIDKQYKMTFLLLFVFFLVSLFLDTANVTNIGFDIYKNLFHIPGFSMFRNFYGQWAFLYIFFLTLLVGYACYIMFKSIGKKYLFILIGCLSFLYISSAYSFINGDLINPVLNKGSNSPHRIVQFFDPSYEQMLSYIRDKKLIGTYFSFPFTESFYELVAGTDGGVYIGPSIISHLTGNYDIPGHQNMEPLGPVFLKMAKDRNFQGINNLFSILNIRYIYYNADKRILEDFPETPYAYVKDSLPSTQKEYQDFMQKLPVTNKVSFGKYYSLYEIQKMIYLPKIFIATSLVYDTSRKFDSNNAVKLITTLTKGGTILKSDKTYTPSISNPTIIVQRVNPTKFYVHVYAAHDPYFLVFSQVYNTNWRLYLDTSGRGITSSTKDIFINSKVFETMGKRSIAESSHQLVNYYANGWYITPRDTQNKKEYTLVLEMASQKYYYIALFISGITFLLILGLTIYEKIKKK